jgi:vancomycin permeability regulator SanA
MDLIPEPQPGFDREQWTTCHITRLTVGDILAFTDELLLRPAVVTAAQTEEVPGDQYGLALGTARFLDNGEEIKFKARGNLSVAMRCDLRYTP